MLTRAGETGCVKKAPEEEEDQRGGPGRSAKWAPERQAATALGVGPLEVQGRRGP